MDLSVRIPPEMADALRSQKGRAVAENASSNPNMVKLTPKSSKPVPASPNEDKPEGTAAGDSLPDSWEDYIDDSSSGCGFVTGRKDASARPRLQDIHRLVDLTPTDSNEDECEDQNASVGAVLLEETAEPFSASKRLDEPCIFVNLDKLCGFKISTEQAGAVAARLKQDLLGTGDSGVAAATSNAAAAATSDNSEKAQPAVQSAQVAAQVGEAFIARTAELFEMGVAVHATRKSGPAFSDDFMPTSDPPTGGSNISSSSSSSDNAGIKAGDKNGGAQPEEEEAQLSLERDVTWVAIPYPPVLPTGAMPGRPTAAAAAGRPDDESCSKSSLVVPTAELWRGLFDAQKKERGGGSERRKGGGGGEVEGEDEPLVLSRLRALVRSCSQPLPWKVAMSEELCALAGKVGCAMRGKRAARWAKERDDRVEQLDEVRVFLIDQLREFQDKVADVTAKRDALQEQQEAANGGSSSGASSAAMPETFAGFTELLDDDGNRMAAAASASAAEAGAAENTQVSRDEAESKPLREEELAVAEAQARAMVDALSDKLDQVDTLYSALLDEDCEEEREGNDDDDDGDDDSDEGCGVDSGGRGENTQESAAKETAAAAAPPTLPPPPPETAAAPSLPQPPPAGAKAGRVSLRPGSGSSGAHKKGAAAAAVEEEGAGVNGGELEESRDAGADHKGGGARDDVDCPRQKEAEVVEEGGSEEGGGGGEGGRDGVEHGGSAKGGKEGGGDDAEAEADPALLLGVVDQVLAMVLGRLPRRPGTRQSAHFHRLATLHALVRAQWVSEFSAMSKGKRDWGIEIPTASPTRL